MHPLHNYIGDVACLLGGADDSDAAKVDSDTIDPIEIAGLKGVLFIAAYGPLTDAVANSYAIVYASNGSASAAAASDVGWTCTDCTLTVDTTVSTGGGVVMGYLDIAAKGFPERGVLCATRAATEKVVSCLIGIPVIATGRMPAATSSNVTVWNSVS